MLSIGSVALLIKRRNFPGMAHCPVGAGTELTQALMLTAPSLSRSDLHWAYVYRVLGWVNDFQQSGSILRQRQQSSSTTRYAHAFTIDKTVINSRCKLRVGVECAF